MDTICLSSTWTEIKIQEGTMKENSCWISDLWTSSKTSIQSAYQQRGLTVEYEKKEQQDGKGTVRFYYNCLLITRFKERN